MPESPSRRRRRAARGYQGAVDASTPAVVLKLNPGPLHYGALGAIRSLGRVGVPVYAVPSRWTHPPANSRYLCGGLSWRSDPDQIERTEAGLRELAERIGRPAVVIATDEASAIFLAEHGDRLRDRFLFPKPPASLPRQVADKVSLHRLCRELGMPTPRTHLVASLDDARKFAADAGYPVIAKLATAWSAIGSGLPSASVIGDERGLADLHRAGQAAGAVLLLQERIPRAPGSDWFFEGYCGTDSECSPAFTGLKQRSYPRETGATSLYHSVRNDELRDQIRGLLSKLSYRGIMDIDVRRDPATGDYLILDFNPRLGMGSRVCQDRAGLDVALAAYLDLTSQAPTVAEQAAGRALLVENRDIMWAIDSWRHGGFSWKDWRASVRGAQEAAWFARDDLRPFAFACGRIGWHAAGRFVPRRVRPSGAGGEARYRPGRARVRLVRDSPP